MFLQSKAWKLMADASSAIQLKHVFSFHQDPDNKSRVTIRVPSPIGDEVNPGALITWDRKVSGVVTEATESTDAVCVKACVDGSKFRFSPMAVPQNEDNVVCTIVSVGHVVSVNSCNGTIGVTNHKQFCSEYFVAASSAATTTDSAGSVTTPNDDHPSPPQIVQVKADPDAAAAPSPPLKRKNTIFDGDWERLLATGKDPSEEHAAAAAAPIVQIEDDDAAEAAPIAVLSDARVSAKEKIVTWYDSSPPMPSEIKVIRNVVDAEIDYEPYIVVYESRPVLKRALPGDEDDDDVVKYVEDPCNSTTSHRRFVPLPQGRKQQKRARVDTVPSVGHCVHEIFTAAAGMTEWARAAGETVSNQARSEKLTELRTWKKAHDDNVAKLAALASREAKP